jgi:hypothetical protein
MLNKNQVGSDQLNLLLNIKRILTSKGNFAIFYMLAKYVPSDIKYIFTKFYRHISTNNEANRKFVILIYNFSTSL